MKQSEELNFTYDEPNIYKSSPQMKQRNEAERKIIGDFISQAIKTQTIPKERLSRQAFISKRITYNILNGDNYTIDSLISILKVLKLDLKFKAQENQTRA